MAQTGRKRPVRIVRSATVTQIDDLSPRVRNIRLSGPELRNVEWLPGHKIKIRVGEIMRSYTPAHVDLEEGWMDIIFFLHGSGPASQWAAQTKPGDAIQFVGPSKSVPGVETPPDWALFLGDETAIGLAKALLAPLPESVQILGAIEVDESDSQAIHDYGLPLAAAIRNGAHGDALLEWLRNTEFPPGEGMIWVSGEATSAKAIKDVLVERNPPNVQFKMKPYWSCKGHAHRKAMKL